MPTNREYAFSCLLSGGPITPDGLVIRDVVATDAASIATIYNQGIVDRIATLETEERTPGERTAWLTGRVPRQV